jgi:transposase InsO family protein
MFAAYGLPEQVMSDNGSQFTLQEFADFMKRNGTKHINSTPYHPSMNGLAERFVQTFKRAMLKDFGSRPTHRQLANFYWSTVVRLTLPLIASQVKCF